VKHHRLQRPPILGYRSSVPRPIEKYAATINLGGLSGLCILLGCVLGILIGGAVAPPIHGEPWVKSYGPLIGAIVSLIGTLVAFTGVLIGFRVATRNVLRQMRVNLMSREEDRIERILPGLQDARALLLDLGKELQDQGDRKALKLFEERGIYFQTRAKVGAQADKALEASVERILPRSDDATHQLVTYTIYKLAYVLRSRDFCEAQADEAGASIHQEEVVSALEAFVIRSDELSDKIRRHTGGGAVHSIRSRRPLSSPRGHAPGALTCTRAGRALAARR
jgi:hypothetical protein